MTDRTIVNYYFVSTGARAYPVTKEKDGCYVYLEAGLKRNTTRVGLGTITVFDLYK